MLNENRAGRSGKQIEVLKSVVVGLSVVPPPGKIFQFPLYLTNEWTCSFLHATPGESQLVFSVPPLEGDEVVSIRLIPCIDSSTSSSNIMSILSSEEDRPPIPAIMFLTQSSRPAAAAYPLETQLRSLQLLRCPKTPLSQWALEIGMLPDPHPAYDCLPWVEPVTVRCIVGESAWMERSTVCIWMGRGRTDCV